MHNKSTLIAIILIAFSFVATSNSQTVTLNMGQIMVNSASFQANVSSILATINPAENAQTTTITGVNSAGGLIGSNTAQVWGPDPTNMIISDNGVNVAAPFGYQICAVVGISSAPGSNGMLMLYVTVQDGFTLWGGTIATGISATTLPCYVAGDGENVTAEIPPAVPPSSTLSTYVDIIIVEKLVYVGPAGLDMSVTVVPGDYELYDYTQGLCYSGYSGNYNGFSC
jgi:hypothetical protein